MRNYLSNLNNYAPIYGVVFFGLLLWFGIELSQANVGIPWSRDSVVSLSILFACVFILIIILRLFFKAHISSGLLFFSIITIVGAVGFNPLFAISISLFSSVLIGNAILNKIRFTRQDLITRLFQLTIGLGVYATFIGLMALLPINYPLSYIFILLLPIVFWKREALYLIKDLSNLNKYFNNLFTNYLLSSSIIFCILVLYGFVALLPELGHDALVMHLTIPAHVSTHHEWSFDFEKYVWAVMPMNGDWLYSLTYMLGGEYASRLTNLALLIILVGFLVCAVRKFASSRMVTLALGVFLCLPLTYLESSSLFIENAWAVFSFAAIYSFFLYVSEKNKNYLFVSSALLGFALSTKVVTLFLVFPLVCLALFYIYRREKIVFIKDISICLIIFIVLGSIPYAIAFIKTGNPVYPFFNAIFKSPFYDTVTSFSQPTFKQGFDFMTLRDITFASGKYIEGEVGSFGWVFFCILPFTFMTALISRVKYALPLTFVSIAFIALVFQSQSYLRYIYPIIPILIVVMVQGIDAIRDMSISFYRVVIFTSVVLISLSFLSLPAANGYYRDFKLTPLFSPSSRAGFIYQKAPVRQAVKYINAIDGKNVNIGVFASPFVAQLKGTPYLANWYNDKFARAINAVKTETQLIDLMRDNGIKKVILDVNYGNEKILELLNLLTVVEKEFGTVSVRSLKINKFYTRELLKNSGFESAKGWAFTEPSVYNGSTQSVIATVPINVTQAVQVLSGGDYLLSAIVRCVKPESMFRLQVNWLSKNGDFLGTDLTPHLCTDEFSEIEKITLAPEDASVAIVYASGHWGDDKIEYKSLSFKR